MLYINTQEALGEQEANLIQRYRPSAMPMPSTYGDGHMQPYEWICNQDSPLLKVDGAGHDCDHTLIGRQPVAWDLAGAIVEWRLEHDAIARLLRAFYTAGGAVIDADTLRFYQAAYLAFRIGQCSLSAQVHDPDERDRLSAAATMYKQQLARMLDCSFAIGEETPWPNG